MKEYFESIIEFEKRDFDFTVEFEKLLGNLIDPETWIKNDIDYLKTLWEDIAEKASAQEAPALVYEDVNSVLRALRDWIDEDINKIIIDSRYHYNEVKNFCEKFMPALSSKIELYHGDIPLFDAYGISQE